MLPLIGSGWLTAAPKSWTLDAIMDLKTVSDPEITADGSKVAYVVTGRDAGRNAYSSEIWVVPAAGGPREAWIELDSRTKRLNGSGGCNRMSGGYETDGGNLRFGAIAATRMACADMRTETEFFRALGQTRRYSVSGRRLDLMDRNGVVLATLEERDLR